MSQTLKRFASLAAAVLLVMFAFMAGTAVVSIQAQDDIAWPDISTDAVTTLPADITESERLYAGIYNSVSPSVVSINVVTRSAAGSFSNEEFFGEGTGTGFVIDTQGHIVTNNHVVDGAISIEVNFFDGRIVRGEIVGLDPDSDLAVIRVDLPAEELQPVPLGDSDSLFIGQEVVAIGSPFNQPWTMTTGIISALDRTIQGLTDFSIGSVIQTDAAINPGNSGGPLLNLDGEVIGVNSQIISQTRSNSGVGFAIPSNLVTRVSKSLIETGKMEYSYMGISGGDISLSLIESLGLPNNARGVVVANVVPGSPAANAGLRNPGRARVANGQESVSSVDIITAIDGTPLTGMSSLITYLASNTVPGQTVTLTVVRDGQQQIDLQTVMTARPSGN
jgi:2-alkenal reductase